MTTLQLYFATNRRHQGEDQWRPTGYGTDFSADGQENLRFGRLSVEADDAVIDACMVGTSSGEALAKYFKGLVGSAAISAYAEQVDRSLPETVQKDIKLGSQAMFDDLQKRMLVASDVLVYIHGFNVSWVAAAATALALQTRLNGTRIADAAQSVAVVLFSWPSDGAAVPWVSYRSDRSDAEGSGKAVGRAILKMRDFLIKLRAEARAGTAELCKQDIHLLCHSMGNYVLQQALVRVAEFSPGHVLPRLFDYIFMCAPDVDDAAFEDGQPLAALPQIARQISIYHNRNDLAMTISDTTKGNPERLGTAGLARPGQAHQKIEMIDCTEVAQGAVGHSYYMNGVVNDDIRLSIDSRPNTDTLRARRRHPTLFNVYAFPG